MKSWSGSTAALIRIWLRLIGKGCAFVPPLAKGKRNEASRLATARPVQSGSCVHQPKMSRTVDAALIALAIFSRVAAVWVLQSHLVPRSTYEHGEIAANILAGRGFAIKFLGDDGPTSQQAPLYPAIVAIAYAIGGVETPRSLLFLELGQSILGGLLVLGVLRTCRLIAPPGPGWHGLPD